MPSPTPRAERETFDCVIRVDPRAGSQELVEPLRKLGCTVREERLPAGDIELIGIDGTVVGVEYKKWPDVLACVRNGRFAEQLRAMKREYHVSWLLVEGRLRVNTAGRIELMTDRGWREADGGYTYQEAAAWLMTMVQCGGALTWLTASQEESALWVRSLYFWWTFQAWEEHRAHKAWFEPPPLWENPYAEPPLALRVANVMPGLGSARANALIETLGTATHYPSPLEVMETGTVALKTVPGIGKIVAQKFWEAARNREKRAVRRTRVQKDSISQPPTVLASDAADGGQTGSQPVGGPRSRG